MYSKTLKPINKESRKILGNAVTSQHGALLRHIWPKTCTTFHPLAIVTSYMALVTAGNTQVISICYLPQVVLTTYMHLRAQLYTNGNAW